MIHKYHLLSLLYFPLFIFCDAEKEPVYCPPTRDYGLVELAPSSYEFIPYDYAKKEKLIFKNSAGKEIFFYPYRDSVITSKTSRGTFYFCTSGGKTKITYESRKYELRYTSTYGYRFFLSLRLENYQNIGEASFNFFDLLRLTMYHIGGQDVYNQESSLLSIPINRDNGNSFDVSEPYNQNEYKPALQVGDIIYKDVYVTKYAAIMKIIYSKQVGLIALTDVEGVEWIFDRRVGLGIEQAAVIELPDTSGNILSLNEIDGKLILIDFWASWCRPCRTETEEILLPLYLEYHKKGLEILSVSIDAEISEWKTAIKEDQTPWYHVIESKGYDSELFTQYQVYGIPTIYIIDGDMKILSRNSRGEDLKNFVESYFD